MRMRRKRNLDQRIAACGGRLAVVESNGFYNKAPADRINYLNFTSLFGNNNPIYLEIGCGKGRFSIRSAKENPDINFVAVEKTGNVIIEAVEMAERENISNLVFLNAGAENLLCYMMDASVNRIYLNFSCPYPKNTYANRRLTHKNYLSVYKRLLCSGAEIHQKTDNMKFFEYSLQSLSENGFCLKNISLDLHNSGFIGNIETEYEKIFISEGKPIYRLEAYLLPQKE